MEIIAHGARVNYEQYGTGPDILILHGWGCQIALMRPLTERLSRYGRVTVIDFPGHGKSGRPPEPWGVTDFAAMLADLIERLGITGCDIVAHSNGARCALVLAATRPELVGKLAVTGSSGLRAEATEAGRRKSNAFKRLRGVADALDKIKILGPLPEKMRDALRQKYGSEDYKALDAEMRQTFVKLVNQDISDYLPCIKAPVLLLWGDLDAETPLWMGQRMEALIPDAGLVILKGGTHFAYLEKSGEFLRIVEHFFFGGHE